MSNYAICRIVLIVACLAVITGCANVERQGKPAAVPEIRPGVLAGYLASKEVPDSSFLLPPPPAPGSAKLAFDEEVSRKNLALRGTPRWKQAALDAELTFPDAAGTFSCAINAPITEQDTPRLYTLLRRIRTDASRSTHSAKSKYMRVRPFVVNNQPTCSPDEEKSLRKNGSYPSGHTTIGWAWALALTEIAPDRANAILARGRAFGESRLVCNVHWQSDVTEGYFMGTATIARLHGDPSFRADVEAAREELAAVRARGLKPTRDCKAEAEALGY
ncbi:MAG: Major phosphate-irrepressible acid phosphatase precursor [Syntrophorhabdus sp. PtaU1.Bin058]|nr:MAG: Major phosphate-irrepressible acid phosphatase precursor [Syntrophorhabdus sp. PtaU1.Bin058]